MLSQNHSVRMLWAVDAFEGPSPAFDTSVEFLRMLGNGAKLEIRPVYVLSPDALGIATEFAGPTAEAYLESAKKAFQQRLAGVSLPGLGAPEVLIQHRSSLRGAVDAVAKLAEKGAYDAIVTGSQGHRGIERLVLGSFAESLLLHSTVPVLVIGAHARRPEPEPLRFLLPSDLSDPRSPLFDEAFALARTFSAPLTLLHAVPRPIETLVQSGVYLFSGGWVPVPIYLEKEHARQEANGKIVRARARENGLECALIVDSSSAGVVESILHQAREARASMIVMAAESGPLSAALLGSIARKVIREAPCPVWVLGKKAST